MCIILFVVDHERCRLENEGSLRLMAISRRSRDCAPHRSEHYVNAHMTETSTN